MSRIPFTLQFKYPVRSFIFFYVFVSSVCDLFFFCFFSLSLNYTKWLISNRIDVHTIEYYFIFTFVWLFGEVLWWHCALSGRQAISKTKHFNGWKIQLVGSLDRIAQLMIFVAIDNWLLRCNTIASIINGT